MGSGVLGGSSGPEFIFCVFPGARGGIMKLEYHSEEELKHLIKQHWENEPCESRAGRDAATRWEYFNRIDKYRYEKSPFIPAFARFAEYRGKKVLEVGLGSGSDFMQWARNGAVAFGRDLTEASVKLVKERLTLEGLVADVAIGDVEALEFPNDSFDLIYSYGVIHHSPDTGKAVSEIYRVLRPGGSAKIMIYHLFGAMNFYQWILFALLKLKPWRSIREVVYYYNESIGTKLYTKSERGRCFPPSRMQTSVRWWMPATRLIFSSLKDTARSG